MYRFSLTPVFFPVLFTSPHFLISYYVASYLISFLLFTETMLSRLIHMHQFTAAHSNINLQPNFLRETSCYLYDVIKLTFTYTEWETEHSLISTHSWCPCHHCNGLFLFFFMHLWSLNFLILAPPTTSLCALCVTLHCFLRSYAS